MSIDAEILSDFAKLVSEHGVSATWKEMVFGALMGRIRADQQIDVGGFVESPDTSLRTLKALFIDDMPKHGDRVTIEGTDYRISRVGSHPRSPLITIHLISVDE